MVVEVLHNVFHPPAVQQVADENAVIGAAGFGLLTHFVRGHDDSPARVSWSSRQHKMVHSQSERLAGPKVAVQLQQDKECKSQVLFCQVEGNVVNELLRHWQSHSSRSELAPSSQGLFGIRQEELFMDIAPEELKPVDKVGRRPGLGILMVKQPREVVHNMLVQVALCHFDPSLFCPHFESRDAGKVGVQGLLRDFGHPEL